MHSVEKRRPCDDGEVRKVRFGSIIAATYLPESRRHDRPKQSAAKRTFRTPPVPGISSPAKGFSARKSISSRFSSSLKSFSVWRVKIVVSATDCMATI